MTTATKNPAKSTPAPAKRQTAKQKADAAKAAEATPAPAAEPKAPKAAALPTYREAADFTPALKAAKSAAKGNVDLTNALQLVTHLAWKTPGGVVGWAAGTTENVKAYADDVAVPEGTPIPEALAVALGNAEKAASEQPQKDAVAVLAKVINGHAA